jgi:hypothetical protein
VPPARYITSIYRKQTFFFPLYGLGALLLSGLPSVSFRNK